jgi:hypothetical protein
VEPFEMVLTLYKVKKPNAKKAAPKRPNVKPNDERAGIFVVNEGKYVSYKFFIPNTWQSEIELELTDEYKIEGQ